MGHKHLDDDARSIYPRQSTVLIVDRDRDNAELLQHVCESCGCSAITATDGRNALQLVERYQPILIFVELMLPLLDGIGLTRYLRWRGSLVPIIAVTTLSESEFRQSALLAGCNEFLGKPFDIEALQTLIEHYLHPFSLTCAMVR